MFFENFMRNYNGTAQYFNQSILFFCSRFCNFNVLSAICDAGFAYTAVPTGSV